MLVAGVAWVGMENDKQHDAADDDTNDDQDEKRAGAAFSLFRRCERRFHGGLDAQPGSSVFWRQVSG